MFHLFRPHREPELKQLLSEFNRSLMLIADKQLLIKNFIAKVKQICPVDSIHLFLLDSNTEKYKLQDDSSSGNSGFFFSNKIRD